MSEDKKQEFDIELTEEVSCGHYANLVIMTHSASEFVLDFAALMPGVPKASVKSRIILTPEHAKRLLITLLDNITHYESNVARIEINNTAACEELENITTFYKTGEA